MPFTTLTAEEQMELYRLKRIDWREGPRCGEVKAYLAGCIMLRSAVQTLLILMVNCFSTETTFDHRRSFVAT